MSKATAEEHSKLQSIFAKSQISTQEGLTEPPKKRKRGRPRKKPKEREPCVDLLQELSKLRFKRTMEDIYIRYGRDLTEESDEIDLITGEIVVDRGFLRMTPKARLGTLSKMIILDDYDDYANVEADDEKDEDDMWVLDPWDYTVSAADTEDYMWASGEDSAEDTIPFTNSSISSTEETKTPFPQTLSTRHNTISLAKGYKVSNCITVDDFVYSGCSSSSSDEESPSQQRKRTMFNDFEIKLIDEWNNPILSGAESLEACSEDGDDEGEF
ncbi:8773_t:CDS:1 [Paraglomus occultum]|uniref:8773_t:CDS:1 n=1 Tax=Paraglomus occultum TaxID=144539 RepID=A0A9N9FYT4_9GLOM|nr:8773_t:CDS:1 [Paraglomus occultum]